jgi:hypothetical protein
MQAWQSSVTSPSVLAKGKACSSGIVQRRTLSKESLLGQVSAKLTPEICINNATSNSRLTAVGGQATATDSHSQTGLQTLFFLSPYLWWENNWATPACWKTYWNCIAFEHGTLCGVLVLFPFLCGFVLFYVTPLMRQLQNNIWDTVSRIGGWGMNTKIIKTETSVHLNLEVCSFYILFYIYIHFFFHLHLYFYSYLTLFYFLFSPSLCLSNAFSAYGWLVHYPCLYLWNFFVCFFVLFFSTRLFVFPISFNSFAFHTLSPFHSKYH